MKVLVPIKRVIDAYVKVRIKSDHSGVEENKMSINPFDEIAIEAAVTLKEKGLASEVILISIGDKGAQETLRQGLALGADRAIHLETQVEYDSLNIARILQHSALEESVSLVIMGKQSIDNDHCQTGQMLAGLLDWPQHTFASKIEFMEEKIKVTREVDGGLETLLSELPAVVTTDLRLNEPRYATLPNIMKAKRKPLMSMSVEALKLPLTKQCEIISYETPKKRSSGEILGSIDELLIKLKENTTVLQED